MLAEALDRIRELCRASDGVQLATHEGLPEKVVLRHGDKHELLVVPPARRSHTVFGYPDVVAAASDPDLIESPEVFHCNSAVVVHLKRSDRRDIVTMPLQRSDRWAKLVELSKGARLNVRDAVRMLRFDLHGTGVEPVALALSKVDFTRRSDGGTHVEHGRESLGRSVEAAVQQAADIPPEFEVACSIYVNPGLKDLSAVSVRVGVYLDVQAELIELRVLADELANALHATQASLGGRLAADLPGVPLFHGHP